MKNFDKEDKRFKIFTYITLFITGFYFFAHILFMVFEAELITPYNEFEHSFFLMMLFMDIVGIFIYTVSRYCCYSSIPLFNCQTVRYRKYKKVVLSAIFSEYSFRCFQYIWCCRVN